MNTNPVTSRVVSRCAALRHLLLVAALTLAATAPAQNITWGTANNISGDTDVSTAGTLVYGYFFGNTPVSSVTLNGVPFTGVNTYPVVSTNINLGAINGKFTQSAGTLTNTLSQSYSNLLNGVVYVGTTSTATTITLSNLVAGHPYQVQFWVNDSRSLANGVNETNSSAGGNSVVLKYNTSGLAGGWGQWAIGTFTAGGSTEALTVTPLTGKSAYISAIQVRDLTQFLSCTNTATGNWSAGSSWQSSSGPAAGGQTNFIIGFNPSAADNSTNDLAGAFLLNQMVLWANQTVNLYVTNGSTQSLVFTNNTSFQPLIANNYASTLSLYTPITLATNLTVSSTGGGTVALYSNLTETAAMTTLVTMLVTDLGLNLYYQLNLGIPAFDLGLLKYLGINYGAYVVLIWLGRRFRARDNFMSLLGGGILGAILFYVITNTAAWLFNPFHNPEYTRSLAGWLIALTKGTAGYPQTWEFFRNTLLGGGLFTGLFAGAMKLGAALEEKSEEAEPEPAAAEEPQEAEA